MPGLPWEAADASPGQVPTQAPQAGWQDCSVPEHQGVVGVGGESTGTCPQLGSLYLTVVPSALPVSIHLLSLSTWVSPLQGPFRVQRASSHGTKAPARKAVVLLAFATPPGLPSGQSPPNCLMWGWHWLFLYWPLWNFVTCCDGSFKATCGISSHPIPLHVGGANPT